MNPDDLEDDNLDRFDDEHDEDADDFSEDEHERQERHGWEQV